MIFVNESELFSIQQTLIIQSDANCVVQETIPGAIWSLVPCLRAQWSQNSVGITVTRFSGSGLLWIKPATFSNFHAGFRYRVLLRDHDKNTMNVARSNQEATKQIFPK